MKLAYVDFGVAQRYFEGDSAGGDELLIIPSEAKGALAVLSSGSDYGSWISVYDLPEEAYLQIIGDEPPFHSSYEARSWLEQYIIKQVS